MVVEVLAERPQLAGPEALIVAHPIVNLDQRAGIHGIYLLSSDPPRANQLRFAQDSQML